MAQQENAPNKPVHLMYLVGAIVMGRAGTCARTNAWEATLAAATPVGRVAQGLEQRAEVRLVELLLQLGLPQPRALGFRGTDGLGDAAAQVGGRFRVVVAGDPDPVATVHVELQEVQQIRSALADPKRTPLPPWSIVAHSMGTSVAPQCLVWFSSILLCASHWLPEPE